MPLLKDEMSNPNPNRNPNPHPHPHLHPNPDPNPNPHQVPLLKDEMMRVLRAAEETEAAGEG